MRHDLRRIIARANQLMSLCDELEAGLARSQADGERLMEFIIMGSKDPGESKAMIA